MYILSKNKKNKIMIKNTNENFQFTIILFIYKNMYITWTCFRKATSSDQVYRSKHINIVFSVPTSSNLWLNVLKWQNDLENRREDLLNALLIPKSCTVGKKENVN